MRDQAVVGAGPDVAQLVGILAASRPVLLVAVDRQRSRMLRVLFDEVEELEAPIDDIPRQVDTDVELGSFEHRHEEFTRKHIRRVARAVVEELRHHPAEHLVLSGSRETVAQLEAYLPQHTLVLLSGRIDLPTSSRRSDLARATNELVQETHRRRQLGLAKELRDRANQGAAAVTGLTATLDALSAQRVEMLVVDVGFEAQGVVAVPATRWSPTVSGVRDAEGRWFPSRTSSMRQSLKRSLTTWSSSPASAMTSLTSGISGPSNVADRDRDDPKREKTCLTEW